MKPGDRLGVYEILTLIGRGGMGEVYRARDATLGREVALKVLPDRDRLDERRLARFEREAGILATLNHPNISTLLGIENAAGVQALVMELIVGDTLADVISGRALRLGQAVGISHQIVDALEAAHALGIVHRDLKPDNVKVRPDGAVKVVDFGLAKAFEKNDTHPASLSTITNVSEQAIVGTASYMSPEQARGLVVDARTDIWSFGCVLFEMVTGRRAFEGATNSDIIAAVLDRDPDWTSLPATTPAALARVLRRCLEKEPSRRIRHIADVRADLDEALHAGTAAATIRHAVWLRGAAMGLAVAAVVVAGWSYARSDVTAPTVGATQYVILPPSGTAFGGGPLDRTPNLAISPDGERLAFTATGAAKPRQIWVQRTRSLAAQPVGGTENARELFWSPDGESLGFFADGKLKTVAVNAGAVTVLADAPSGSGGTWNRDGVILFAPTTQDSLFRVSEAGGRVTAVTTVARPDEYGHVYPQFLPDGSHFIYLTRAVPARKGIYVASLDDGDGMRVLEAREKARFAAPDRLLFLRDGTLLSQHFDLASFQLTGEPVPVADSVGFIATDGRASYDVSTTGVVAYRANGLLAAGQPVLTDRAGRVVQTLGEPGDYQTASFSPQGDFVAVEKHDLRTATGDLWLLDLKRAVTSRLTFDGMHNTKAIWSPDGRRIVFTGRPDGVRNLHVKDINEERDQPLMPPGPDRTPSDWSRDGRRILYHEGLAPARDIWYLSLPERQPQLYLRTEFDEAQARFSPDGRWVAYVSNETGNEEVYVRSFPNATDKRQISAGGGVAPRWSRGGHELFFVGANNTVQVAAIRAGGAFTAGVPHTLFTHGMRSPDVDFWFDAFGERFIIVPGPVGPEAPSLPITITIGSAHR